MPGQLGEILPAAVFTGLFATVAAFYLQTYAQRFTTPTHTALIFTMEPVFAGLFGYLLAGERLGARGLAGCGLILAGILIGQVAGSSFKVQVSSQEDPRARDGLAGREPQLPAA